MKPKRSDYSHAFLYRWALAHRSDLVRQIATLERQLASATAGRGDIAQVLHAQRAQKEARS